MKFTTSNGSFDIVSEKIEGGRIQNRVRLENLQEHQYNTLVSQ
jgi:hypothetical protein